jgi:uncharacterized DUF497 family protein
VGRHGIRFEEAVHVFDDPFAIVEQRWQTIGAVRGFLLVVAHTVRFEDDPVREVIRIISVRQADRKERRHYENGQMQARRIAAAG